MGYGWQSDWHFIDQPYLNEGGSMDDYDFEYASEDCTDALDSLTKFLSGKSVDSSDAYVSAIQDHFSYESDQLSFALRLVIHYVGDIHQPLHATAAVDPEYPSGDRGGNDEKVSPSVDGASNLHAVWDSVIYKYTDYPNLPLSDSDWSWYTSEAATNFATYPIDNSKIEDGDFSTWAVESLESAEEFVYPGFFGTTAITEEYKEKAIPELFTRINYGARRLADLMKSIYGSNGVEVESLVQ